MVDKVEGTTMTVETPQGTVQVIIADDTSIQKMGEVELGDILPGERVTVSGETATDGSITAATVFVTPGLLVP